MHIRAYLELLRAREQQLAEALIDLAGDHADLPDLAGICQSMADWSQRHVEALHAFILRCAPEQSLEPAHSLPLIAAEHYGGSYGLVHDLHALWLLAHDVQLRWEVLRQVAWALRDRELLAVCEDLGAETGRQLAWVRTRMAESAPQAIIAAP